MRIGEFESIRPPFETRQEETLAWLVEAHVEAEKRSVGLADPDSFRAQIAEQVARVCCKADRVSARGHVVADYLHRQWDEMEIYRLDERPEGADLGNRCKAFEVHVDRVLEKMYATGDAPDELIHVTCTGYVAPSGAQKLVARRGWNCHITHAYHMGCYAALPALRIAAGYQALNPQAKIDIVHTEICSLHTHPLEHGADQLVAQSLFADGFIRYRVGAEGPAFETLQFEELLIPNTEEQMTWNLSGWGFSISLARQIPLQIVRALPGFLKRFEGWEKTLFAVHPGGPKILDYIQSGLALSPEQLHHSGEVLRKWGNMSSATLPHIWQDMLASVPVGQMIMSLAFGPGLTLYGSLMRRVA